MFRGKDVQEIKELRAQGLSLRVISDLTGYDRKTIRRYLIGGNEAPVYGPRPPSPIDVSTSSVLRSRMLIFSSTPLAA